MTPAAGTHVAEAPAFIPALVRHQDPVWLVESARSAYRLPRLQAVIRGTIAGLQALTPAQVLGKEASRPESGAHVPDPVSEALRACSAELREACGIAGAQVARMAHCNLVRRYASQRPAAWRTTFGAALEGYRHAACSALLRALDPEAIDPEAIDPEAIDPEAIATETIAT